MDRTVKILLTSGVLLLGTSAAMLFRRPAPEVQTPAYSSGDPLVFRQRVEPQVASALTEPPKVRIESRPAESMDVAALLPTILRPMDPGQPPPQLARAYPGGGNFAVSHPAGSTAPEFSGQQPGPARTHKIVDGDTLTKLAQRYLGDADRYIEIFEANRDVLGTPQLLPIGAKLRIPPRDTASVTSVRVGDAPSAGELPHTPPTTVSALPPLGAAGKRLVPVAPRKVQDRQGNAG